MMKCELTGVPENQIDQLFNDMTSGDIYNQRLELYGKIQSGEAWDEDCEGYRQNMFIEWESIMLQYNQGLINRDEVCGLMSDVFDGHIWAHCESEIS